MEPNETQEKYDLIPANYRAIQGLVMSRARQLVRETGQNLGRSTYQAQDEIAAKLIVEKVTGQELGSWLTGQRNGFRHQRQEYIPPAPAVQQARQFIAQVELPAMHVNQPIKDDDTFRIKGVVSKHRVADPVLMDLTEKCKRIQVGEVWSFPCASIEEASTLAKYLPKVAKLLGWRAKFGKRSYQRQVFPDRLKIKRVS